MLAAGWKQLVERSIAAFGPETYRDGSIEVVLPPGDIPERLWTTGTPISVIFAKIDLSKVGGEPSRYATVFVDSILGGIVVAPTPIDTYATVGVAMVKRLARGKSLSDTAGPLRLKLSRSTDDVYVLEVSAVPAT